MIQLLFMHGYTQINNMNNNYTVLMKAAQYYNDKLNFDLMNIMFQL